MVDDSNQTFFMWLAGLAVTIVGALFGYTHVRIGQVHSEMRKDIDELKSDVGSNLDAQSGEYRQVQQQLWSELRLAENRATDHRQRMQERIGQLPTRDEMKQDLAAMEKRIEHMLQGSGRIS